MADKIKSYPATRKGGERIPIEKRRVRINLRVSPATASFLDRIGAKNYGRAVDQVITDFKALARSIPRPAR